MLRCEVRCERRITTSHPRIATSPKRDFGKRNFAETQLLRERFPSAETQDPVASYLQCACAKSMIPCESEIALRRSRDSRKRSRDSRMQSRDSRMRSAILGCDVTSLLSSTYQCEMELFHAHDFKQALVTPLIKKENTLQE